MAFHTLQIPQQPEWSAVLQAHRGWLSSVVYARLHDQHAVEEVLQETALAASRQTELTNDQDGICRWLYRVAIRQALLYRRRQFRQARKISASAETNSNRPGANVIENPYQMLIAAERQELVQSALEKLAARDCEVLMLKYRDGWSCRQMANRLEVSESAMKSRLLRARKNLRTELLNMSEYWDES